MSDSCIDVSIILPIFNASQYLMDCLESILSQKNSLKLELSIFLDSCSDDSEVIVQDMKSKFVTKNYIFTVDQEKNEDPKGVGYAKNKAVHQSRGHFLCFMDADDIMLPNRIETQYKLASENCDAIIGSKFLRDPPNSTKRYTNWANSLSNTQLTAQIYTSHGPTVIMPTWFCHKNIFKRVGGFVELGKGTPEDLIFFYDHLRHGGKILRADQELLIYRFHPSATTFSVHKDTIWTLRMNELEDNVLKHWTRFSVWNAGKQGRKFYRGLSQKNREKVEAFCDVDIHKIGNYYTYEYSKEKIKPKVPIIHFKSAKPPFIICVKLDMTDGKFEENLSSLNLEEGKDYFHFS